MSLTILTDNIGDTDLIAVDSPLFITVQVDHDGNPNDLYFQITDYYNISNSISGICVPYRDLSTLSRVYIVELTNLLRALFDRGCLNDFNQSTNSLSEVEGITKKVQLQFSYVYQDGEVDNAVIQITACRAARQHGQSPSLDDVNDNKIYTSVAGGVCYLYIYNDDENNIITVDGLTYNSMYALQYDEIGKFLSFEDNYYTLNTI